MSVVCESLEAYKKLVHVDVSGLSWLHLDYVLLWSRIMNSKGCFRVEISLL